MARIGQDQIALDRLIDELLDQKERHVTKHRRRLAREADDDVQRAHERYCQKAYELELARDELVEARRTRRWVQKFPGEETRTDEILPAFLGGGLLNPIKRTLGTTAQVSFPALAAALRADADVLRDGLPASDDGLIFAAKRSGRRLTRGRPR